ncbi:hypothetical protein L873DRAFT_1694605, partial [Choiromyces venosus 120613-1]
LIILFFDYPGTLPLACHAWSHCVAGIALPPVDANSFSLSCWPLCEGIMKISSFFPFFFFFFLALVSFLMVRSFGMQYVSRVPRFVLSTVGSLWWGF